MNTLFWLTGALVWFCLVLAVLATLLVLVAKAAVAGGCVAAQLVLARCKNQPVKSSCYAVWHNRFFDFTLLLAWQDMWQTIDAIRFLKKQ